MAEAAKAKVSKRKSLTQQSNRNMLLSIVLFAVLISTVFYAFQQAKGGMQSLGALYADQLRLEQFKASLPNLLLPLNDYTMTGNAQDVEKLKKAANEFQTLFSGVEALPSLTADDKKVLGQVFGLMREVMTISDDIVSGKIPSGQANNVAVVAQNLVFVAQQKLNTVAEHLNASLQSDAEQKRTQIDQQNYLIQGIIVFLLLLVAFLSRRFVKNITLTITDIAKNVTTTSNEILSAVDQQANAADTQAKSVEQIALELREMSEASRKIAATSASVEKIAEATASSANEGVNAVTAAIQSMRQIREEVDSIAEKVTFAGQKASQILESVDSLQEIADETHLLALNASIESAAAGEFGKRFAVVASEVRRLADRTREFTEEIQTVVNEVHKSTQESVEVTRVGIDEVGKGVDIARQAGDVLQKMQTMSSKTSQAVRTIAQATSRQNDSNQDFLRAMQQISDLLRDSAAQMQKSRNASFRLNEVADELQRLL